MARERDFFRLNKQDRADLLALLERDVVIPDAIRDDRYFTSRAIRRETVEAFFRLHRRFITRLCESVRHGR